MNSLDRLTSDQRALLGLLLDRGSTYDEIAKLLWINRAGVRERALVALDALSPQNQIAPERRALITDYLLGQLPKPVTDEIERHLAESAGEREWARVVSSALEPLARRPLRDLPREVSALPAPDVPRLHEQAPVVAAFAPSPFPSPVGAPLPGRRSDLKPPRQNRRWRPAKGRIAAVAAIALVVAIVVITSNGSDRQRHVSATPAAGASTPAAGASTTASTSKARVRLLAQVKLTSPIPGSKTAGIADVLTQGATKGIAIGAQNVTPNRTHPANAYAVWLYNSPTDAHILGFVSPGVGKNGRLTTAGGVPSNASRYTTLIVSLETRSSSKAP